MKKGMCWLLAGVLSAACSTDRVTPVASQMEFKNSLSAYGLFAGNPAELEPGNGVEVLELASALFTDYAEKQRLLKLPPGRKMQAKDGGLPVFPEGTILAKTFFYFKNAAKPEQGRQIIETRLLILQKGRWNLAVYRWNAAQSDAYLLESGADIPVSWIDVAGKSRQISYHLPAQQECVQCHQQSGRIVPIGPKIRNLNIQVQRDGKTISQLSYLETQQVLKGANLRMSAALPAYTDVHESLEKRTRAYLEINCAHCHQPGGTADVQALDLRFETELSQSGICAKKWNILSRTQTLDAGKMPAAGTSVLHREGILLLESYLKTL
jgi:uncharacterized repeat protein (TIGR03806 family)